MSRGMLVLPSVWMPATVRWRLCRQGPVFTPRVVTGVTASFIVVELALALVVSAGAVISAAGVTVHRVERSQSGGRGVGSRVGVGCREMRVWVCYVSAFRMSVSP